MLKYVYFDRIYNGTTCTLVQVYDWPGDRQGGLRHGQGASLHRDLQQGAHTNRKESKLDLCFTVIIMEFIGARTPHNTGLRDIVTPSANN